MTSAIISEAESLVLGATAVGGKAWQLAQLRHFGLPVPDFVAIPASWSEARHGEFPEELASQLASTLAERGWLDRPLAVRSSAVGEDSALASFAGIYRSCLNVRGLPALLAAIAEVWTSLDSETASAYRQGIGQRQPATMAVIVMPLLAAEASGIAFTCDPVSGREDRLIVHANWGLGESLVGGEAAGDEYVFAEDTSDIWRLIERRQGSKATMSVSAAGGGTVRVAVPAGKATASVFDTAQAEALAALLWDAAVALDFVAPFYDLEWVWDGTRCWLTQARPVTRRPRRTYAALQGQLSIWTRGNTREIMPEPLQPMDWNFSRRGVNHLLEQGWKLAGYPLLPGVQRAGLFHGRLYLEAAIMQWEAWDAIGLTPEHFNTLLGGHQPTISVNPPAFGTRLRRLGRILRYALGAPAKRRSGDAAIARVRASARQALGQTPPCDAAGWRERLYQLCRPAREEVDLLFLQGSGGGSLSLLVETLEKIFPDEGAALGAALLAGGDASVTAQQGYALLALARLAARCGHSPQKPPEFARAFAAFLDEYGHRGHYETYIGSPRWREQPETILEQLPALAQVDEKAIVARQQAAADAAWQRLRQHAPLWKTLFIKGLVKAANRESNQREAARSALIANLDAVRHAWLGAAAWMQSQGWLRAAEDVFWLLPSEAERAAMSGKTPAAGLQARIAARQALFRQWQAEEAPEFLLVEAAGTTLPAKASPSGAGNGSHRWRGVATGTGRVQGRVRILRHPSDGGRLQAGEILVAPSTDPGWTPLFLRAGGLVVETGGYLSHGAIVAREFALPAVVNLPGILDALQDGDEIEVDGLSGEVRHLGRNGTDRSAGQAT
nr:PEP/pyruvate-binding domain-containing protein [uncultured Pseudogulbenkiania sp.]